MSFKIASKVWDFGHEQNLDSSSRLLLMALADSACDQTSECWPSVKLLSKKTGLSERTIKSKLSDLSDLGIISRRRTRNNSGQLGKYIYRLDFAVETSPSADSAAGKTLGATTAPSKKLGANNGIPRCNLAQKLGATIAPHNLSLEPIKEPIKQSDQKTTKNKPPELPDWMDPEAWAEFVEHRKSIKKPMSALAEKKILKKLQTFKSKGMNIQEILDLSIENGWSGVFPSNGSQQKNKNSEPDRSDPMVFGSPEHRALEKEMERAAEQNRIDAMKNFEIKPVRGHFVKN